MAPMKIHKRTIRGEIRWVVETGSAVDGTRKRLSHATRAEAEAAISAMAGENGTDGTDVLGLSPVERLDVSRSLKIAREGGFTLLDAVLTYHASTHRAKATLGDSVGLFLASRSAGYRPAYTTHLKHVLTSFASGRELLLVSAVTPEMVAEFLSPTRYRPATLQGMRRRLGVFFSWCVTQEILQRDPMTKVEFPRVAQSAPKILTVDQSERLMRCAEEHEPGFLRWLALALFCGIRPEEIRRLKEDDIKIDRGFVEIGADASKVGARRLVNIPDNARGWIARPGPLVPVGFWKRLRKLRAKAVTPWACDILRHTAASMMLARDRDAAAVALELGNSPEILFRHYRELVTKEDAARFWAITPQSKTTTA